MAYAGVTAGWRADVRPDGTRARTLVWGVQGLVATGNKTLYDPLGDAAYRWSGSAWVLASVVPSAYGAPSTWYRQQHGYLYPGGA